MTRAQSITKAAYALHRGCSKATITKALKDGRITQTDDGRIDPVAADAQWAANTRVRAAAGAPPARAVVDAGGGDVGASVGDPDYWVSRAKREAAEAEMAELELGKQRGDLLDVASVRSSWARVASSAQQALMQMAPRLAPVLAALTDAGAIQALIDEEVDRVLAEIVKGAA